MRFDWDERKNHLNQRKHAGVSFEMAAFVFEDPDYMIEFDRVDEAGEQRWHALGAVPVASKHKLVLLVVHAYRENHYGEEIIRIISARRASPNDVRRYQEQAVD
jgi:uncharacterized DUF497 family protein